MLGILFYFVLQLPDVQRMVRNVSKLIETGVENEVKRGRASLESISSDVQKAVANTLPTLKQHLRSAGTYLFPYCFEQKNKTKTSIGHQL